MAAIFTTNITLSPENEFSAFVEFCNPVGAYILIVRSEIPEGSHAVFHIASSNDGQKRVKRTVWVGGNNGEQLHMVWPDEDSPILCYESDVHAPLEERHYNVKII